MVNVVYESAGSSRQRGIAAEIQKIGKAKKAARYFSYRELVAATDNFNPDCLVGEGGFGSVYKGYIESIDQVCRTNLWISIF